MYCDIYITVQEINKSIKLEQKKKMILKVTSLLASSHTDHSILCL